MGTHHPSFAREFANLDRSTITCQRMPHGQHSKPGVAYEVDAVIPPVGVRRAVHVVDRDEDTDLTPPKRGGTPRVVRVRGLRPGGVVVRWRDAEAREQRAAE